MTTTPSQKTYKRPTMKWHHFGIYKSKYLTILCPKKEILLPLYLLCILHVFGIYIKVEIIVYFIYK